MIENLASETSIVQKKLVQKKPLGSVIEIRRAAMDLLTRREYTRLELNRKLLNRIDRHELLEQVLNRLAADGLQSDERFTESYSRFRRLKGMGPTRIKAELREKGVSEKLISEVIYKDDPHWLDTAKKVLKKKYGETKAESAEEVAKRIRFLSYRGFENDHIEAALNNE